jgi:hypothetical protein
MLLKIQAYLFLARIKRTGATNEGGKWLIRNPNDPNDPNNMVTKTENTKRIYNNKNQKNINAQNTTGNLK